MIVAARPEVTILSGVDLPKRFDPDRFYVFSSPHAWCGTERTLSRRFAGVAAAKVVLWHDVVPVAQHGPDGKGPFQHVTAYKVLLWPELQWLTAAAVDLRSRSAFRGDFLSEIARDSTEFTPRGLWEAAIRLTQDEPESVLTLDWAGRVVQDDSVYEPLQPAPAPIRVPSSISVIVSYRDHPELTGRCIEGLARQTAPANMELILVDNQSMPESRESVARLAHHSLPSWTIKHLAYDAPFNHSAQCNLAVRNAEGEVLLFLNNDVELSGPSVLADLAGWALTERAASAGPRIVGLKGEVVSAGIASWQHFKQPFTLVRECKVPQLSTSIRETLGNSFACAAVPRSVWQHLGGLDEGTFPADYNDADFALRALASGYRHIYVGTAQVRHQPGSSGKRTEVDKSAIRSALVSRHPALERYLAASPRLVAIKERTDARRVLISYSRLWGILPRRLLLQIRNILNRTQTAMRHARD